MQDNGAHKLHSTWDFNCTNAMGRKNYRRHAKWLFMISIGTVHETNHSLKEKEKIYTSFPLCITYLFTILQLQLQGIKWIKAKYGEQLVVVRLDQKNCLDTLELAITRGNTVLIENLPENLDPVLDPLIGKNLIKRGR